MAGSVFKGRFGYDWIYSEDRLKTPLIKENGAGSGEASWTRPWTWWPKCQKTIAKHGPDAIGGVSSSRSINEDSYQLQKLFRATL